MTRDRLVEVTGHVTAHFVRLLRDRKVQRRVWSVRWILTCFTGSFCSAQHLNILTQTKPYNTKILSFNPSGDDFIRLICLLPHVHCEVSLSQRGRTYANFGHIENTGKRPQTKRHTFCVKLLPTRPIKHGDNEASVLLPGAAGAVSRDKDRHHRGRDPTRRA